MAQFDREYDALRRVNVTTLKELGRSPQHLLHRLRSEPEEKACFDIGSATHLAVFQPHLLGERVVIWPKENGKRSGRKWDLFESEARTARKAILLEREHAQALAMAHAVRSHPVVAGYLEHGAAEVTISWEDVETRLPCKGKLDWLTKGRILDLKTTRCSRRREFGVEAWRYGYHTQAAFYTDGFQAANPEEPPVEFTFVAVEKVEPYVVSVFDVDEAALELGQSEYRGWLRRLVELRGQKQWPGYEEGTTTLQLPRWAWGDDEDLDEILDDADDADTEDGEVAP